MPRGERHARLFMRIQESKKLSRSIIIICLEGSEVKAVDVIHADHVNTTRQHSK